jgi:hypothetical protein
MAKKGGLDNPFDMLDIQGGNPFDLLSLEIGKKINLTSPEQQGKKEEDDTERNRGLSQPTLERPVITYVSALDLALSRLFPG